MASIYALGRTRATHPVGNDCGVAFTVREIPVRIASRPASANTKMTTTP
jgi:hypothetical protein